MKNSIRIIVVALVLVMWTNVSVWAGQNASAGIRIDLNSGTSGNQNQTSISPPAVGSHVRVDIYVVNASNLDTYEFNLNYNSNDLQFTQATEDQPTTYENNFLKKDGGSTVGWTVDTSTPGVVNIANTLIGNNPAQAPEGEGLLASIVFLVLQSPPGNLTFGDVFWYDNNNNKDVCTDKGDASLPVELSLFEAVAGDGQILLKWATESEVNSLGFNLYRAYHDDSTNYMKINGEMIKAAGNRTTVRDYSYTDHSVENGATYYYKLESVDIDGTHSYSEVIVATPQASLKPPTPNEYTFSANYPNPFNPETTIQYQLPAPSKVTIKIFDYLGREIRTLVNEEKEAGYFMVGWDGKDNLGNKVSSGIYICRLEAYSAKQERYANTRKMLLLR